LRSEVVDFGVMLCGFVMCWPEKSCLTRLNAVMVRGRNIILLLPSSLPVVGLLGKINAIRQNYWSFDCVIWKAATIDLVI
jgi:hypothetical protein